MKKLLLAGLVSLLTCNTSLADSFYKGTLVDAHSQVGWTISDKEVSSIINSTGVDVTLLSFRGQDFSPTDRFARIKRLTNGKVKYLIPTKLKGFAKENSDANYALNYIEQLKDESNNYVGFGEIIVQHGPHDHALLKYEGINNDLFSYRIKQAMQIAIKDNKPVMLHVELNDFEQESTMIVEQIIYTAEQNPNVTFLLMHMAQAEISEVEYIINNTKNVHFITSHADHLTRSKTSKIRQTGWIKMTDYNGLLKQTWRDLMNKNPTRFVLAFDNVWGGHWKRKYSNKVNLWRQNLAYLEKGTAISIACGNANKYFKLGITCVGK
tara:strand:+ start:1436 stop:2404 length:969 start_codon:yes stop_codon:yes gene_type:complete